MRAKQRAIPGTIWAVRGFSLIEVLLAIFILGVGVISIAALFPAGIAQQRLSADDMLGGMVANNAIEIIRSKVRPEDFGTFESFGLASVRQTTLGDWSWGRPMLFTRDADVTLPPPLGTINVKRGSVSIFKVAPTSVSPANGISNPDALSYDPTSNTPVNMGMPWSPVFFNNLSPAAAPALPLIITQRERYFPMGSDFSTDVVRPQYVWDCAFRRFQGKILVAIFVYRVTMPGGGIAADFAVPPSNNGGPTLPIWLNFIDNNGAPTNNDVCSGGPWFPNNPEVQGMAGGTAFDADDARHAWQTPRQWLVDQNNNIHRVVGASRTTDSDPMIVELVRAAPSLPQLSLYFSSDSNEATVTDVWYIPNSVQIDTNNNGAIEPNEPDVILTPVYATVKEL